MLLCPWDSPGKHTGVGCPALLQGIFLTQGSNPHLFCLPVLATGFFTINATCEILQARILEWIAYPFFSRSF